MDCSSHHGYLSGGRDNGFSCILIGSGNQMACDVLMRLFMVCFQYFKTTAG